jgi:hypothetical protein
MRLEKRIAPRRNTLIRARIHYSGVAHECIIRNVSDTGAKLETSGVNHIPQNFELHAPGHRPQTCLVVWRAMRELGVQFQRPEAY